MTADPDLSIAQARESKRVFAFQQGGADGAQHPQHCSVCRANRSQG
jgi:hypothetical protein